VRLLLLAVGPPSFLPTLTPSPMPPLPRRHGTDSGAHIAFSDTRRDLSFGAARSRLINQIRESYGNPMDVD